MLTNIPFRTGLAGSAASARWLDVVEPTAEEVASLEREHRLPGSFITHSLDVRERPRIDEERDATLVILRAPRRKGAHANVPYTTAPLGFILAEDSIITISRRKSEVLEEVRRRVAGEAPPRPLHVLLLTLEVLAERYLACLDEIDAAMDRLEERLSTALHNQAVQELLKYQKGLVYFVTALRGNELVLDRLKKTPAFHIGDDDSARLEDVMVEIRQAIEASEIMNEILSNLMDAFASLIANNLNSVMKVLAALGVIVSVPVIIASLYGMNVPLPGARSLFAFPVLVVASLLGALLIAWFFRRRDWF